MSYYVALVGVSYYQEAIERASEGEDVSLMHDPSNAYDDRAIIAISIWGEFLGHVPRDSWLTTAMLDEGKTVAAVIERIGRSDSGHLGVVLDVDLAAQPRAS